MAFDKGFFTTATYSKSYNVSSIVSLLVLVGVAQKYSLPSEMGSEMEDVSFVIVSFSSSLSSPCLSSCML